MIKRLLKIFTAVLSLAAVIALSLSTDKSYYFAVCAVLISALALFAIAFEKGKGGARQLVIISVVTALSVAGRVLFAQLPSFKPVAAIVILAAVYFGAETGFASGALTALVSNIYFGQGPWTPFQMFAWGFVGFAAGMIAPALKKRLWLLLLYGAAAGIVYSLILDINTVLWLTGGFEIKKYIAAVAAALPVTVTYCASNVLFLLLLARPAGKKLERIKLKYGL